MGVGIELGEAFVTSPLRTSPWLLLDLTLTGRLFVATQDTIRFLLTVRGRAISEGPRGGASLSVARSVGSTPERGAMDMGEVAMRFSSQRRFGSFLGAEVERACATARLGLDPFHPSRCRSSSSCLRLPAQHRSLSSPASNL